MSHDEWLSERLTAVITERDDLRAELVRIAAILATFYESGASIHTLQPVLDLAVELTPSIATPRLPYD